ncbi:MAG TPA: glucose-1-phosphate thymidylyltransferase, partial [Phycisphaerae bacterium]
FLGNGNKQHHGFLGQSIVGEWVNLGAGTTTSNVKNTYGTVKMPLNGVDESSGRQFLGSIIGDHAKLGIGTYLSTGSVVGFGSHIVAPRPPRFVPSFAWVTDKGIQRADFEKLEQIAGTVMSRRGAEFTPADHELWVRIASEWALGEKHEWRE